MTMLGMAGDMLVAAGAWAQPVSNVTSKRRKRILRIWNYG
jgi:hypothetical protein